MARTDLITTPTHRIVKLQLEFWKFTFGIHHCTALTAPSLRTLYILKTDKGHNMADRNSPWARAKAEIYGLQHQPGLGLYGIQLGIFFGIASEVYSTIWPCEVQKTDSARGAGSFLLAFALFLCYAITIWNLWPAAFSIFKFLKYYIQDMPIAAEFVWLSFGPLPWVFEMVFGILCALVASFVWMAAKTDLQCLKSKNCTGLLLPHVAAWLDRIATPFGGYDSFLNLLWILVPCLGWVLRRIVCNKWETGAPAPPAQPPAQLPPPPPPPPAVDEQLPHVPEVDVQALMELLTAFDRLACQTARAVEILTRDADGRR